MDNKSFFLLDKRMLPAILFQRNELFNSFQKKVRRIFGRTLFTNLFIYFGNSKRMIEKKYFNIESKKFEAVPGSEAFIILDSYRAQKSIIKNSECTVHDIGDGVLCLEFTSKSNSIGEGIGRGIDEAIRLAEEGDWKGIVIGNNAKQF